MTGIALSSVTIRRLYHSRRRAYDDVRKLSHLDGPVNRVIAVHPDGVYIRVVAVSRLEENIKAILLWGKEVDSLPDANECSEYYSEEAISAFASQRRKRCREE